MKPFKTPRQLFYLSLYWFAMNFLWGAFLVIVLPAEIHRFSTSPGEKYQLLGIIAGVGALVAMVVQPVSGACSDRSLHPWGRRRPFILAGTIGSVIALLTMAYAPNILTFAAAFFGLQLFSDVARGAYNGIIPDLVPAVQRGVASGYMGLMTMLGTICGVVAASVLLQGGDRLSIYWLTSAILLAALGFTLWGVPEIPLSQRSPLDLAALARKFWISPRRHPNFAWVFLARLLVMLGFYTMLDYLQYYLQDVLHLKNYIAQTGIVSLVVLAGALASSLVAGRLSDRLDRRSLVFASGAAMAGCVLAFVFIHSAVAVYLIYALFGIGYGAYISVDWAMAIDVLPAGADAGKDLGVWAISTTLPQIAAPLLAGNLLVGLLPYLHSPAAAYEGLYVTAALYFLLGSRAIWQVRLGQPTSAFTAPSDG